MRSQIVAYNKVEKHTATNTWVLKTQLYQNNKKENFPQRESLRLM